MKKDLEPAFPSLHWVAPQGHNANENPQGMTLRDYFAAKAMQAILADQYANGIYVLDLDNDSEIVASNAAYTMADAMMKARSE
jgi:hypothetical protein